MLIRKDLAISMGVCGRSLFWLTAGYLLTSVIKQTRFDKLRSSKAQPLMQSTCSGVMFSR